ncbi:MBL fold metallo-hydrolase [Patescibacteria group bacterium]|nr:MBL fold metallo-hydrolase [Patescibacteria group bacterium]
MVEIVYIGHASFKIRGKDLTLIIDPYDPKIGYNFPKQKCDLLLTTHDHFDHHYIEGVSDYKLHINGPGEYEMKGVFVYGIPTYHDSEEGAERGENTIYLVEIDGFNILHLGDLGHELSKESLSRIPLVDVLLIPVGGKYTIDAEVAAKVVSSVEPGFVVPMHYATKDLSGVEGLDGVEKFLDEMGIETGAKKLPSLKLSSKSDIPEETEVVELLPQH